MNFFSRFFKKKELSENEILNIGLDLAMEFGQNWLQPINDRLGKKVPYLNSEELERFDEICRGTMKYGHRYMWDYLEELSHKGQKIRSDTLKEQLRSVLSIKYPWVNDKNLSRLFSQGMYYAWKDGLDKCVT